MVSAAISHCLHYWTLKLRVFAVVFVRSARSCNVSPFTRQAVDVSKHCSFANIYGLFRCRVMMFVLSPRKRAFSHDRIT